MVSKYIVSLHQPTNNDMKTTKIIFYISTGLLTVLMFYSVWMYFFQHEAVVEMFKQFGYPTYIIYPYAIAKLFGMFALWNPKFKVIKEWAYAAFTFAFTLAFFAHYMIGDGEQAGAVVAFVLLIVSYITHKKITK